MGIEGQVNNGVSGYRIRGQLRVELLLPIIVAIVISASTYFRFIQNHFFNGAFLDAGWYSFLAFKSSILLENPRAVTFTFGETFYAGHASPILFILSLPSNILPFDHVDNLSLIFGFQGALLVLVGSLAVLALGLQLPPFLLGILAALTGLALCFSPQSLLALGFPHFEPFFAPFAILFLLAYAKGLPILAAVFFALMLAVREDTGFHIFGIIFLWVAYERVIEKVSWEKLRQITLYGLVGFCYPIFYIFARQVFLAADLPYTMKYTYLGDPLFSHVTLDLVLERLGLLIGHRIDLVLAVAGTAVLAYFYRRPQYLIGYAAFVPWTVLNLLATREAPGKLDLYHGFPFVLALAWPVIYEVLKMHLLAQRGCPPGLIPKSAQHEDIRGYLSGGDSAAVRSKQAMAAVLATIGICAGTVVAAPHVQWVIGSMVPARPEKREATHVLMDFLNQGWAERLGLKGHEGAAAVSPDRIGELNRRGRIRLEPDARGVIFFTTEFHARHALGFAVSQVFDENLRLGGSSIHIAFRGEDRERIRHAIEQANAGRVRIAEGNMLYGSLRAGPAGQWVGDRLGSAPARGGLVAYGPYLDLEPGSYRMSYRLKLLDCGQDARQLQVRLGITANFGEMFAPTHVSADELDVSEDNCSALMGATFRIEDAALGRAVEFPIWNDGPIPFWIEDITLVRIQ